MEAPETTIPAPAPRTNWTKIAAIATAVTALALALAGATALAANAFRDDNGYFNWPTKTFTSSGYAITTDSVDISHAPKWAFGDAGLNSVRVKASSNHRLFIGIARTTDLNRYLRESEYDQVAFLTYHPFQVYYNHSEGHAPPGAPASKSFWIKSTSGTGDLSLAWKPRPGDWRAVVMNADGSLGVTTQLELGARTSLLWWLGGALLGLAVMTAMVALALRYRAAPSDLSP